MLLRTPFGRRRRISTHASFVPVAASFPHSCRSFRSSISDLEILEERTLLAAFTVTSIADTIDTNPGNGFAADASGTTTLRAAIQEANALPGSDIIILPSGTYALTRGGSGEDNAFSGDLDVTSGDLTIIGAGAERTFIDASDLDRVLHIFSGATLRISGVTIQNGTALNGGGILNAGTLFLSDSIVTANIATGTTGVGGGIGNSGGRLDLDNVIVSSNTSDRNGGGLHSAGGVVTISDGTFISNTAGVDGGGIATLGGELSLNGTSISGNTSTVDGGGLSIQSSVASLYDVTVTGNVAQDDGGGINLISNANVLIEYATISNNTAADFGGGLRNFGAVLNLQQSTISGNQAGESGGGLDNDTAFTEIVNSLFKSNAAAVDGGGINNYVGVLNLGNSTLTANQSGDFGGGLNNGLNSTATVVNATVSGNTAVGRGGGIRSRGTTSVANTIVSGNLGVRSGRDVFGNFTTLGNNLIGEVVSANGFINGVSSDQVGTESEPLDPLLGPLQDNGGATLSMALTIDSPAIDAGNSNGAARVDQTGDNRLQDGDLDNTPVVDIGAVEFTNTTPHFTVNTTVDTFDESLGDGVADDPDGNVSLRSAVQEANAVAGMARIQLPAGIYTLSRTGDPEDNAIFGDLDIRDTLIIEGAGAEVTFIDAAEIDRVFHVQPNVTLTVIGVTIRNGSASVGGGVYNSAGNVMLQDVVLTGNTATDLTSPVGGAIANERGTLILDRVTVSGNQAGSDGGGVYSFNGGVTINESTFSGNTAVRNGGAIAAIGGAVSITESTITGNTVTGDETNIDVGDGGGLALSQLSLVTIVDSTISGNSATDDGGGLFLSSITSATIESSTIASNTATGFGGGVHNVSSALTLIDVTVSGNAATVSGGGINNEQGTLNVNGSTIHTNSAVVDGGGIDNFAGVVTLRNATLSGNSATANGGGIVNYSGGSVELLSTTVANNTSGGFGGGLWNQGFVRLGNSIVATNSGELGSPDIAGSVLSLGTNLLGINAGNSGLVNGVSGDFVGTFAIPLDPVMTPLQDNGGTTLTHGLRFGSPAIESGTASPTLKTDQRGRLRVVDGDLNGVGRIDIGATEFSGIAFSRETDGAMRVRTTGDRVLIEETNRPGSTDDSTATRVWFDVPIDEIDQIALVGGSDSDVFIVDIGVGTSLPSSGLILDAIGNGSGNETTDAVYLVGGTVNSVEWTISSETSADTLIDGRLVQLNGFDAYTETMAAAIRSYDFIGTADGLLLTDQNAASNDGMMRLTRTAGGIYDFLAPTETLGIGLGVLNDSLQVVSLDALFAANFDVQGGDGDDRINLEIISTNAEVDGGNGNDMILTGSGHDLVYGSSGSDDIQTASGNDTILAGSGRDTVIAGDGNDWVSGQGGSGDSLSGGAGDDTIDGGSGNDFLFERADTDFLLTDVSLTGLGNDTIIDIESARLGGGDSDNVIDAQAFSGYVRLQGFGGNDRLLSSAGGSRSEGDDGDDSLLGGDGNDLLFGGAGRDTLIGGAGNDDLLGNGGSGDFLRGGPGNDKLDGGPGIDRLDELINVSVVLTDSSLSDPSAAGIGYDRIMNIEMARITGNDSPNTIDARAFSGSVVLFGAGGNDTLLGGAGNDTIDGGDGDDAISGGGGNDSLRGDTGDDTLLGGDQDDTLLGSGGNDILIGGSGGDYVNGNGGANTVLGGAGDGSADAGDRINASASEINESFQFFANWIDSI